MSVCVHCSTSYSRQDIKVLQCPLKMNKVTYLDNYKKLKDCCDKMNRPGDYDAN